MTDGGSEFAEIREALDRARAELEAAETAIADTSAGSVIALHPNIAEEYRRSAAGLRPLLKEGDEDSRRDTQQRIRALIDRIVVTPAETGPGTAIALEGRLEALLALAGGKPATSVYASGGAQERTLFCPLTN